MEFDYSKQKKHKLYYFAKPVARVLSYFVYEIKHRGVENIPKEGGLIIASNHIAFSDPAVIMAYCPRTVHFMAKSELFRKPIAAMLLKNLNAFPVRRNYSDRNAIRYARAVIDKGWILGIFPEGRRVRKSAPTQAKSGVSYLARVTGADVLPVCIYRDIEDNRKRHGLSLVFGKVIKNSELGFEGKDKNAELEKASEIIMSSIRKLWEEENCK